MTRYWFVRDHCAVFPINKLCELVELPRANYHRWTTHFLSSRYLDDAYPSKMIFDIWQASGHTYGSPLVWRQLRSSGVRAGLKLVARLMAECGLVGTHVRTIAQRQSQHASGTASDRNGFTAAMSNLKWMADTTLKFTNRLSDWKLNPFY